MPTKQASSVGSRKSSSGSREETSVRKRASGTGQSDEQFALISILYHALQGAETCESYIDDARKGRDDELVAFFEEVRDDQADCAARAKQLLASRLEGLPPEGDEDEEEEEEEDDEDDEEEDADE